MTIEKAKELLEQSEQIIGTEVEVVSLSARDNKFNTNRYRIVDAFSFAWSIEDMEPVVDAWAKLETRDGKKMVVSLQSILNNLKKAS